METEKKDFLLRVYRCFARYDCFSQDVAFFIACQVALESDFGRSRLAREFNNYIGMRISRVRPTTRLSFVDTDEFSRYDSFDDCLFDYLLAVTYHQPLRNDLHRLENYARFISRWYCPEHSYIERILSIYNQFINLLN